MKSNPKKSVNAQAVAHDVVDKVRKGQKVSVSKIMRSRGYSKWTSKKPSKVTKQKSYKEILAPVIEQLEIERQRAISKLKGKISKAKYRDLVDGVDKLTKNIQLLSGKETDHVKGSVIYLPSKQK